MLAGIFWGGQVKVDRSVCSEYHIHNSSLFVEKDSDDVNKWLVDRIIQLHIHLLNLPHDLKTILGGVV